MVANRLALSLARAMSTAMRRVSTFISWAGARVSRDLGLGWEGSGLIAVTEAEAVAERPQRRLAWTSRLLLVAALAVPLLLLTIHGTTTHPVPSSHAVGKSDPVLLCRRGASADNAADLRPRTASLPRSA